MKSEPHRETRAGCTARHRSPAVLGVGRVPVLLPRLDATIVGGFRQWLKQGRCVKKGEHRSDIWIPLGDKEAREDGSTVITMTYNA
jgi:hypothetical protein